MLTQAVLLFYGTQFFPVGGRLEFFRFVCYGIVIMFGFMNLRKLKLRKPRVLDLIACGILAYAFFSITYSIHPKVTLYRSAGNLLLYLSVFWVFWISCRDPDQCYHFIQALIFVWLLYYGLNMVFLYFRPNEAFQLTEATSYGVYHAHYRFAGITENPNGIGNFSAIVLPLIIWNQENRKNFISLLLLGAVVFSMFYSYSRDAFICGIIGLCFYLYLSKRRHGFFIFVVALFLSILIYASSDFILRFLPTSLIRSESLAMLGGRVEAWDVAIKLLKDHPFRGYGFGVEDLIFEHFGYAFQFHAGAYVHSSFLGLALQLGWIAAGVFYFVLVAFFIASLFKVLKLKGEYQLLAIALYVSCLTAFLTSFVESWLYSPGGIFAFPFFMFMMLLMRMLEFQKSPIRLTPRLRR